jgi:plastocyanin
MRTRNGWWLGAATACTVGAALLLGVPAQGSAPTRPEPPRPAGEGPAAERPADLAADRLTPAEYHVWVGETLSYAIGGDEGLGPGPGGGADPGSASARQVLAAAAESYRRLGETFAAVRPPAAAEAAHEDYVAAAEKNVVAFEAALARTPEDAPGTAAFQQLYADPDAGYAFVAETNAKCALNRVFDSTGFAPHDFRRWCDPQPRPGESVGTRQDPVQEVTLTVPPDAREGYPNMWFDVTRVVAASGTVTVTFENGNPPPYLFNVAVYRGNPRSLEGHRPIAQTSVSSGPTTQVLEVELEPGVYTYADNVHPYSMRGTLVVVPG